MAADKPGEGALITDLPSGGELADRSSRPAWHGWRRVLWDALLVVAVAGTSVLAWWVYRQGPFLRPGSLSGRVVDLADGPIADARVTAEGTRIQATTDAEGFFRLAGLPAGDRWLTVEVTGQGGLRLAVSIPSGGDLQLGEVRIGLPSPD